MDIECLYKLSEKADKILQTNYVDSEIIPIIDEIKGGLSSVGTGTVGIVQLSTNVGDLENNAKKIMKYISYATELKLDMVIFPEYALVGYPIDAILNKYPLIIEENKKWLNEIAKLTSSTVVVLGFVEALDNDKLSKSKNISALAIMQNGKIQKIVRSNMAESITICNKNYAFCFGNNIELVKSPDCNISDFKDIDVFVDCSILPMQAKKGRFNEIVNLSNKCGKPLISVNQVGVVDGIVFDGQSQVLDGEGHVFARAKGFEEQFLMFNLDRKIGKVYESDNNLEDKQYLKNEFSLDYDYDLERVYKVVIQGIREYFRKNGLERACLGLSGGLDSTVCAVLLADALGKENVCGISMPSKITTKESKSDAKILAQNIGINYTEVTIKDIFELTNKIFKGMFDTVETKWNCRYQKSYTQDNIQARSRAMYLWGIANEFSKCIPIATSDKSEVYMGYATINGDMSGGFAPIADITKTKLFAFARWLNNNRSVKNVIPESIILRRPGAELAIDEKTGKPLAAEDALMPYEFMDEVIWRIETQNENFDDMINSEFLYEKKYELSKEEKVRWLEKFYNRMAAASYKKSILPPYIVIDSCLDSSISSYFPISYNVNYKSISADDIKEKLKKVLILK